MKIQFVKNKYLSFLLVMFLISGSFLIGNSVYAIDLGVSIAQILGHIVSAIIYVLGQLLGVLIGVLIKIAQYNDFIKSPAVTNGWVIVRDLCNMFFILILLIIAFATILRQENYSVKKLLPKLLIMAVLINFSKTICGIFIDFAQIIMLTFVNSFKGMGGANLTTMLGIDKILQISPEAENVSGLTIFGSYMLALLYVIISIVVIVTIIAVLVMRMVMLWIYIVLSPLAYLLAAFPAGQKYASQWWDEFTKNLIVGPVLAFFIWLSFASATTGFMDTNPSSMDPNVADTVAGSMDNIIKFIISIGMLLGGLMVAQQAGGAVGSIAGKGMAKAQGVLTGAAKIAASPLKGARMGAGALADYGIDKLHQKTGVDLNLPRVWKGMQAKRAERKADRYSEGMIKAGQVMAEGGAIHGMLAMTGSPGDAWDQITTHEGLNPTGIRRRLRGGGEMARRRVETEGTEDFEGRRAKEEGTVRTLEAERQLMWTDTERDYNTDILRDENILLTQSRADKSAAQQRLATLVANNGAPADIENAKAEVDQFSDQEVALEEDIKKREANRNTKTVKRPQEIADQDNRINIQKKRLEEVKPKSETLRALEAERGGMWTTEEARANTMGISGATTRLGAIQGEKSQVQTDLNTKQYATPEDKEKDQKKLEELKSQEVATQGEIDKRTADSKTKRITSKDNIEAKDKEIKAQKEEIAKNVPAYAFEARAAEQKAVSEKTGKIKDITDANELLRILQGAITDHDKTMVKAITKKMTREGNDNEFLQPLAGDTGHHGLKKLMNDLSNEKSDNYAGFTQQEARGLGSEIAEINKGTNHWGATSSYLMENGQWRETTDKEHYEIRSIEAGKMEAQRAIKDINRLGYGKEDKERKFHIDAGGLLLLKSFDNEGGYTNIKNRMNESAATHVYDALVDESGNLKAEFKDMISDKLLGAIKTRLGNVRGQNFSSQYEQVRDFA